MRTLLQLTRRYAAAATRTSGVITAPTMATLYARPFFSFASPKQALVKSHRETKVVPFSREEMFDVVVDVNKYHEFLPFCVESRVLRRPNDNVMEAKLRVGFKVFTESYTSRVIMKRPEKVVIKSIESPTFKRIESEWVFRETGDPNTCAIDFSVTFEVASFLHANAIQLFFDDVAVAQLSAFIERTRKLHGARPRAAAAAAAHSPASQGDSTFPIPIAIAKSVQHHELTAAQRAAASVKTAMSTQQSQDLEALFEQHASEPDKMFLQGFEQACCALSGEHADFKALAESSALAGAVFSGLSTSEQPKEWLDLDEFVVGVYLMTRGTVEQKAQSLFHAIDTSCDGKISRDELTTAMQQRIRSVRRIFPKLLQDQVAHELQQRGAATTPLSADADAAMARALAAIETLMEEVEKDIPLAVNQMFVEADLNQDDFISHDEWLYAWQTHPEFVELMTIDGMKKFAQWASVVRDDVDGVSVSTSGDGRKKDAVDTRLTHVD